MNYFICSKPIHFLHSENIISQEKLEKCLFIILDSFIDSDDFYQRLKKSGKEVVYFTNQKELLYFLLKKKLTSYFFNIYHDWDCDLWSRFYSILAKSYNLYDDGYFTYSQSRVNGNYGIAKKFLKKIFRIPDVWGTACWVNNIYVYHKDIFSSTKGCARKIIKIDLSLMEFLAEKNIATYDIFGAFDIKKSKFISINMLEKKVDMKYIKKNQLVKLHPGSSEDDLSLLSNYTSIKTSIPIEIYLYELYKWDSNVIVEIYHTNTSTPFFITENIMNVKYFNKNNTNTEFCYLYKNYLSRKNV